MAYYVAIDGIPNGVKKGNITNYLKQCVLKEPHLNFVVEALQNQQLKIRLNSLENATHAIRILNDHPYQHVDQQIHYFKSWLIENPVENLVVNPLAKGQNKAKRERESSLQANEELKKIEAEIEIINKKRKLIEAERLLLLEQQKLETLQANRPSAPTEEKQKIVRVPTVTKTRSQNLYWPCKILRRDMRNLIHQHIQAPMRPMISKLLWNTFKERLTNLLIGKKVYPTNRLLDEYRLQYPKSTDEKLVMDIKSDVMKNPDLLLSFQSNDEKVVPDTIKNNLTCELSEIKDPTDLPIHELSQELDDWTED